MRQVVLIEPKHLEFKNVPDLTTDNLKSNEILLNVSASVYVAVRSIRIMDFILLHSIRLFKDMNILLKS